MARKLQKVVLLASLATLATSVAARGATTQLTDVIVPEIFTPYVQNLTAEKSNLIRSGALVADSQLSALLAGGGSTFNLPKWKDLANDADNVSGDDEDDSFTGGSANSTPKKTGTVLEIGVRLSRNQSWSSSDLSGDLAGADPMDSIANRVADYWARRLQAAFISTMKGVYAMNAAVPANGSTHTQNDMTKDAKGASYVAGVTDFGANAFIDATLTLGDSMGDLSLITVHSVVYARMQKLNLIAFIPNARGEIVIPTYLNRVVVVDDGMPNTGGVFESWLFGANSVGLGSGSPKVPTETQRKPDSGNGGGSSILHNRTEWLIHPRGHAYIGTPTSDGGPTNTELAAAASWKRSFPERKQIKMARLITREF